MSEISASYDSGAKKPFVKLEDYTIKTIFSLMDHCEVLEIDNVSYNLNNEETVYLVKYKSYWELIVKNTWKKSTDIYRIETDKRKVIYRYSEED